MHGLLKPPRILDKGGRTSETRCIRSLTPPWLVALPEGDTDNISDSLSSFGNLCTIAGSASQMATEAHFFYYCFKLITYASIDVCAVAPLLLFDISIVWSLNNLGWKSQACSVIRRGVLDEFGD